MDEPKDRSIKAVEKDGKATFKGSALETYNVLAEPEENSEPSEKSEENK